MTTEDVVTGASTSVEILVDVRVEQVWAVVTDVSRTGEWIRQSFTHGPADSGMRRAAVVVPERVQQSVQRRLDELSQNMRVTIAGMMQSIRDAGLGA